MARLLLMVLLIAFFNYSSAQIIKHNWLVGGSAYMTSSKSHSELVNNGVNVESATTHLAVAPDIGYFFIDKVAAGIKGDFDYQRSKFNDNLSKITVYQLGPFARYYVLPVDKQVNLFTEANYQHSLHLQGKEAVNTYSLLIGSVAYFNSSVGLEFTAGYSHFSVSNDGGLKNREIRIGLGLQVHLINEKWQ